MKNELQEQLTEKEIKVEAKLNELLKRLEGLDNRISALEPQDYQGPNQEPERPKELT